MVNRLRKGIAEALLWLAAAVGLICVALVILAYSMNISLVLFRTGSMEPTIPSGSVAVVREIDAREVEVGDVLTVEREAQLPVTHRVTSVAPGEDDAERVITMQGDANEREDPYPYVITEAKVTLFSIPGLAHPIHQMGNPFVLGGLTLGASLLVGWAFWPRSPRAERGAAACVLLLAGGVSAGVLVAGPGVASASASEQEHITEAVSGDYIMLTSIYMPETMQNLSPGVEVLWDVEAEVDASEGDGALVPGLSSEGDVPLRVTMYACSQPWETALQEAEGLSTDDCSAELTEFSENYEVTRTGELHELQEFPASEKQWLRLLVTVPEGLEDSQQASEAALRVHVTDMEESVSVAPPPFGPQGDPGQEGMHQEDPRPEDAGREGAGREKQTSEGAGSAEQEPGEDSPKAAPTGVDDAQGSLPVTGVQLVWLAVAAAGLVLVGWLLRKGASR